jgi:hypothetical protein
MTNQKISTKKLKAIVFTDIVDFTQISAEDEQRALDIIDKQREILKPIVLEYKGEWLKEIGDGLLFSFDSSLDAVQCSIQIQEALKDVDDFKIRIGIHQGDIFIKDGDVYGDDVNIASRVEGFSPEGGISISDKVYKDIQGVKEIKTSYMGHKPLKGINQETKVRCITSHNLPQYNLSKMPMVASYVCFFWAAICFVSCIVYPFSEIWLKYAHSTEPQLQNPEALIALNISQIIWRTIVIFMVGITQLLIGYSTLSFSRGLSSKSQRSLVYLSYIFVVLPFILLTFNPKQQATYLEIISSEAPMVVAFLLVLIVIPSIITIFFKRIFSKKN